ncbi:MAG: DUF6069 family protein [Anaerolineales bacterium]|jgi:hypothetical protein
MSEEVKTKQEPAASTGISLWRAGVVVLFAAVLSNVIAHYALSFVLSYPPDFAPLQVTSIAIFTSVWAVCATLVFALYSQRLDRPERGFKRTGWIVLGLSVILPLIASLRPDLLPIPGGSSEGFLMLIPFHLIAGVVILGLFVRLHEP